MTPNIVEGVIRGKTIELQADPGFGDGQRVAIAFNSPARPGPARRTHRSDVEDCWRDGR